jgi:hypothetical protein
MLSEANSYRPVKAQFLLRELLKALRRVVRLIKLFAVSERKPSAEKGKTVGELAYGRHGHTAIPTAVHALLKSMPSGCLAGGIRTQGKSWAVSPGLAFSAIGSSDSEEWLRWGPANWACAFCTVKRA